MLRFGGGEETRWKNQEGGRRTCLEKGNKLLVLSLSFRCAAQERGSDAIRVFLFNRLYIVSRKWERLEPLLLLPPTTRLFNMLYIYMSGYFGHRRFFYPDPNPTVWIRVKPLQHFAQTRYPTKATRFDCFACGFIGYGPGRVLCSALGATLISNLFNLSMQTWKCKFLCK